MIVVRSKLNVSIYRRVTILQKIKSSQREVNERNLSCKVLVFFKRNPLLCCFEDDWGWDCAEERDEGDMITVFEEVKSIGVNAKNSHRG